MWKVRNDPMCKREVLKTDGGILFILCILGVQLIFTLQVTVSHTGNM